MSLLGTPRRSGHYRNAPISFSISPFLTSHFLLNLFTEPEEEELYSQPSLPSKHLQGQTLF